MDAEGVGRQADIPSHWEGTVKAQSRRSRIIDLLERQRNLSVEALSDAFGVSDVTIRKDLQHLEDRGFLRRIHGGAVYTPRTLYDPSFNEKAHLRVEAKRAVAQAAFAELHTGESVILDGGSTTLALARIIRRSRKRVVVLTNSIPVALELADSSLEVLLLGGQFQHHSLAMTGPAAVATLRNYHADVAFLGATGVDVAHGYTTPNAIEAETKAAMVAAASRAYVLVDASKLRRVTLAKFAELGGVDGLITDAEAPAEFVDQVRKSVACTIADGVVEESQDDSLLAESASEGRDALDAE